MTVTTSVQLPNQPSVGVVRNEGLGGDGWRAPFSLTSVVMQSVSDASGGHNVAQIRFDPNYVQLINYFAVTVQSAAAAVPCFLEIVPEAIGTSAVGTFAAIRQNLTIPLIAVSTLTTTVTATWFPPPLLITADPSSVTAGIAPFVRAFIDNTDTETLTVTARIYNFDKRAREAVPLDLLLASVPRAGRVDAPS